MKKGRWVLILLALAAALVGIVPVRAQDANPGASPGDTQLFHQMISAGCIYSFNQNPQAAQIPADLRDKICYCVDKWFQDNNLNTVDAVKANQAVMPQVVGYCVQVAVRE